MKRSKLGQTATSLCQPRPVGLHRAFFLQPRKRLPQDLNCPKVWRHNDPIVHPFPLAPRLDDSGAPKVSQMAGNLRLPLPQNLDEVANADFLLSHEIQEAKAGIVTERLKETLHVKRFWFRCHAPIIYALTHVYMNDIVAIADMFQEGLCPNSCLNR